NLCNVQIRYLISSLKIQKKVTQNSLLCQFQLLYSLKTIISKVTNIMNQLELEDLIRQSLDEFYRRRIKKLTELKLRDVLSKKNPYLLRAVGVRKASEIV